MKLITTLSRAAGLGLCVVAFTGTALADPGKGNGAPESPPPGQAQKAETPAAAATPAPQAAAGQAKKAENKPAKAAPVTAAAKPDKAAKKAAKAAAKAAKKAAKTAGHSGSDSNGRSAEAHHHVIVCHATGSAKNPYVVINIPWTAWTEGHSRHGGRTDILLKDPASRPGSKDGFDKSACGTTTPSSTSFEESRQHSTTDCPPTVTTTERVLVGIKHFTGAVKNGERQFVVISPSEKSAHVKHADEAIYETRTVTRSFSGASCAAVVSTNTTNTTGVVTTSTTSTTSPSAVASTEAVGGVAGAVSPAPTSKNKQAAKKPAGGVLGAVASAPEAIAETATGNLPFTGIPLWIAALIGAALLGAGLTLRRSTS